MCESASENLAEIYRPLIYSSYIQHTTYIRGTIIESRRLAFVRSAAACVFAQPGRKQQRDLPIDCVCVFVCL